MPPRFLTDRPLSRLAKWLRILGYDARWLGDADDEALIAAARQDDRILLTRSGDLFRRRSAMPEIDIVLVEADKVAGQVRQIAARFSLRTTAQPFSRCLACNTSLDAIDRSAVEGRVPPFVFETQPRFMHCPGCDRIYWEGTHWERMQRELSQIFAD